MSDEDPARAGQGKAIPMPCSLPRRLMARDAAGGAAPSFGHSLGLDTRRQHIRDHQQCDPCCDDDPWGDPEELTQSWKAVNDGREGSSKKRDVTAMAARSVSPAGDYF